jgi:hypothetical protein
MYQIALKPGALRRPKPENAAPRGARRKAQQPALPAVPA